MPGLTSTKIAGWKFIEVTVFGQEIWRCHIVQHSLERGSERFRIELSSYVGKRLHQNVFFSGSRAFGATGNRDSKITPGTIEGALEAHGIEPAEGYAWFDRASRYHNYDSLQNMVHDMERHLYCLMLANPTSDGFNFYGLPFSSTATPWYTITPQEVIPKRSVGTSFIDMRRDTQDVTSWVATEPRFEPYRRAQGARDTGGGGAISHQFSWTSDFLQERYNPIDGRWWYTINIRRWFNPPSEFTSVHLRFTPSITNLHPPRVDDVVVLYRLHLGIALIGVKGVRLRIRDNETRGHPIPNRQNMQIRYVLASDYESRLRIGRMRVVNAVNGAIVGNGLGEVPKPRVVNFAKADDINAALAKLNTFQVRTYDLTIIPDMRDGGLGLAWQIRTGDTIALSGAVTGGSALRALVTSVNINQTGSRPARLRLGLVVLGPYQATQRGEGTPIFFGSRAVTYAEGDTIGYVRPPLLQYGDRLVRFASKGISYD